MIGEHAEAVKFSTPTLCGLDDRGGVCGFHFVIYVGKKDESVADLIHVLKNHGLVDANGYIRGLNRVVVNRDVGYVCK